MISVVVLLCLVMVRWECCGVICVRVYSLRVVSMHYFVYINVNVSLLFCGFIHVVVFHRLMNLPLVVERPSTRSWRRRWTRD
jgi:hypothetical protein